MKIINHSSWEIELAWAESDVHNRREGEANLPAVCSYPYLLEPVMQGQNIRIKMDCHERLKSWMLRFMQFETLVCSGGEDNIIFRMVMRLLVVHFLTWRRCRDEINGGVHIACHSALQILSYNFVLCIFLRIWEVIFNADCSVNM